MLWKSQEKNICIVRTDDYIARVAVHGFFMITYRCFRPVRQSLSNDPILVRYPINTYARAAIKIALRL